MTSHTDGCHNDHQQEDDLRKTVVDMTHRRVWAVHDPDSWKVSFSKMLQWSVVYTVKSFDEFDSIEGDPKGQLLNENTTLGVICALLS